MLQLAAHEGDYEQVQSTLRENVQIHAHVYEHEHDHDHNHVQST
jgi:hypothetical protein